MSSFLQFVSSLREQMHATLTRTDILRPLIGLISLLLSTELIALYFKLPDSFCILVAVFLFLALALYLITYGGSALYRPDTLRSEKYSLQKMAIEHGVFGDSTGGIIEQPPSNPMVVTGPSEPKEKSEGAK